MPPSAGASGRSSRDSSASISSVAPADARYTARQPPKSLTTPATDRASNRPITTPPCTAPTILPLSSGEAMAAEYPISPCVIAVPSRPTAAMAINKPGALFASATAASVGSSRHNCSLSKRARSSMSPKGTMKHKASAQPS